MQSACIKIVFLHIFLILINSCKHESSLSQVAPNIVFIMVDDLGTSQLGAYGSTYYKTPNIDGLAKQGIKFTKAYAAAAICSPTRASIMTGKYPARLRITDFIPGNGSAKQKLQEPNWQKFLPLEETTFAEVLKTSGYKTAWLGKWHLSKKKTPPESLKLNPDKQGFDDTFVTYKPAKYLPVKKWQTSEIDAHNVDTLTNRAISFLENRPKDQPFFLAISHNSIHDPLMEKKALIEKYKGNRETIKEENHPVIAAMMETLDKSVGRIINRINALGLDENTIVMFYSDNGAKHSYAKQTPYKKGKGWLYEGGIHVPLIIKWPGKIKPNSITHEMVSSIDFYPTFANLANIETNTNKIDGISFAPILFNADVKLDRNTLYWHYPHYHRGSGMLPASAIISDSYKLIEWHEQKFLKEEGAYELYNLAEDNGETNNLATKMPEKVEALKTLLNKWKEDVGAQEMVVKK